MNLKEIEQLMNSEEFIEKAEMVDTLEAMQCLFSQYGIETTLYELKQIVASASVGVSDELSEDELDDVSGGCIVKLVKKFFKWLDKKNRDDIDNFMNKL